MTLAPFESIAIHESSEPLVDLADYDFVLEPSYFQQGLSKEPKMFLREETAELLLQIQRKLAPLKIKIWDGYRSREVQNNIYQKFLQELKLEHPDWTESALRAEIGKFVTDPTQVNRIPPHSTGGAVDLTLVDASGEELDMGTQFDFFGAESAALFFEQDNSNHRVRDNRRLLRVAMLASGFRCDPDEWWHFDYGNQLWAWELKKPYAIYDEITKQNPPA